MSARRAGRVLVRRLLSGGLLATVVLAGLTACGGGDDVDTGTDPVEVEVGKAFSWNGYSVDDGWTLMGVKRSAGGEEVTTPEVKGSITNHADEERTALFEMVFSQDGAPVATVNCSAPSMTDGQSQQFDCPGLGAIFPDEYDAVVVQEFRRDDTSVG